MAIPSLIPELEEALRHGSPERRAETVRRIANLFLESADRFNEEHVALFDSVLARLVVEIETKVRAELSHRFAPVPNAPPGLVRTLASDDDITVAGPVLRRSERLAESDLVELARTKGQPHLMAISGRPSLGVAVTDELVVRGDRHVARSLAANREAQLSETGFSNLVERAGRDGVLAERMAQRPDIPPHQFRELVMRATEVVRQRLMAAADQQTLAEIRRVLAKVSDEVGAAVPRHDYGAAQRVVEDMLRSRRLDESAVLAFAEEGRAEETVAALAALCAVPIEVAERLMSGERADPVLILCKALNFSWATARAVIAVRPASGERGQNLDAAFGNFERLLPTTAQRVVRFWQMPSRSE